MKQIFQATSDIMDQQLHAAWEQSVHTAAFSRALSKQVPHLQAEQAMLAGLIHNIGCLPVIAMAENYPELIEDEAKLKQIIDSVSPIIGQSILKEWGFPDNMCHIPKNYQNLKYNGGSEADYVDLVIVARLQTLTPDHEHAQANWSQIPSFRKIGIEPEVEIINIEGMAEEIEGVHEILLN
jgi:HD-like signal output (HDOD) protein